jgi:pilus assembly protein Flp/PilA
MPHWRNLGNFEVVMRSNRFIEQLLRHTGGTSAVEYGLILSLIVIAIVGALSGVADETHSMWSYVQTQSAKAHAGGN